MGHFIARGNQDSVWTEVVLKPLDFVEEGRIRQHYVVFDDPIIIVSTDTITQDTLRLKFHHRRITGKILPYVTRRVNIDVIEEFHTRNLNNHYINHPGRTNAVGKWNIRCHCVPSWSKQSMQCYNRSVQSSDTSNHIKVTAACHRLPGLRGTEEMRYDKEYAHS